MRIDAQRPFLIAMFVLCTSVGAFAADNDAPAAPVAPAAPEPDLVDDLLKLPPLPPQKASARPAVKSTTRLVLPGLGAPPQPGVTPPATPATPPTPPARPDDAPAAPAADNGGPPEAPDAPDADPVADWLKMLDERGLEATLEIKQQLKTHATDWELLARAIRSKNNTLRELAISVAISDKSLGRLLPSDKPADLNDPPIDPQAALVTIKAMLPWLGYSGWGPDEGVSRFLALLGRMRVEGAAAALNSYVKFGAEPNMWRAAAIAIGAQREYGASEALKHIVNESAGDEELIRIAKLAQIGCNTFPEGDFLGAITQLAQAMATLEKAGTPLRIDPSDPKPLHDSAEPEAWLGYCYIVNPRGIVHIPDATPLFPYDEPVTPTRRLITRLLEEVVTLRKTAPEATVQLRRLIPRWDDGAASQYTVFIIGEGEADAELVAMAMSARERIAADTDRKLKRITRRGGIAAGIAAALLADADVQSHILTGDDVDARRALLAAARLGHVPLERSEVQALTRSDDARVAHAATIYLNSAGVVN
ncbi:MAG: hypothetical protein GC159_01545 [Phycisphaera sp.]|nr:hypothetical protein [Phycisphaera sp.]